eukprot:3770780-Pyramimonas_sp.AAC.1
MEPKERPGSLADAGVSLDKSVEHPAGNLRRAHPRVMRGHNNLVEYDAPQSLEDDFSKMCKHS